ncbi:MAG: hypothetical protein AB1540_13590 [Bdellovibrionota bacterium]
MGIFFRVILAVAVVAANSGCSQFPGFSGGASGKNYKYAITPQKLPPGKISDFFSLIGFTLPSQEISPKFDFKSSKNIESVTLNTLALRTLVPADFDAYGNAIEERLLSDEPFEKCEPGQIQANFIESMSVCLQKQSEDGLDHGYPQIRVAHFTRTSDEPICGFYMTIEDAPEDDYPPTPCQTPMEDEESGVLEIPSSHEAFNLKKLFFPKYLVTIKGTGTHAPFGIKLGGYLSIDFVSKDIRVPQPGSSKPKSAIGPKGNGGYKEKIDPSSEDGRLLWQKANPNAQRERW